MVSAQIKQIGLAIDGPDMGDIHPIKHLGLTILALVVGLISAFVLDARWPKWPTTARPILYILPVVFVLGYLLAILLIFKWPGKFISDGTGLGVITSIIVFCVSMVVLGAASVRRMTPASR